MVWKAALALVLLASAGQATAAAKPFAAKVAEAKASLVKTADDVYLEMAAQSQGAGMTARTVRDLALWQLIGYSLGTCKRHNSQADMVRWLSSFDFVDIGLPAETSGEIRQSGNSSVIKGGKADLGLTAVQEAAYCRVELAAIRQLMTERFAQP